jgi:OsmC-like protein
MSRATGLQASQKVKGVTTMSGAPSIKHPSTVNGIDVESVKALIESVKQDPDEGLTRWKVTSAWQGRTHTQARVESFHIGGKAVKRHFTIDIDEPLELGGGNAHPNPQEHLIAGLNACMMVGYVAFCSLNGITLEKVEIQTEGDIDLRGFLG